MHLNVPRIKGRLPEVEIVQEGHSPDFPEFVLRIHGPEERSDYFNEWLAAAETRFELTLLLEHFGALHLTNCHPELDRSRLPKDIQHMGFSFNWGTEKNTDMWWHGDGMYEEGGIHGGTPYNVGLHLPRREDEVVVNSDGLPERVALTGVCDTRLVIKATQHHRNIIAKTLSNNQPPGLSALQRYLSSPIKRLSPLYYFPSVARSVDEYCPELTAAVSEELSNKAYWHSWKPGDLLLMRNTGRHSQVSHCRKAQHVEGATGQETRGLHIVQLNPSQRPEDYKVPKPKSKKLRMRRWFQNIFGLSI